MKRILVIGAGRSSSYLIDYLIQHSSVENWEIKVGDMDLKLAESRTAARPNSYAFHFDVTNENQRKEEIRNADVVVSMLPAFMHTDVAKDCLHYGKHMATASYISPEMRLLHNEAKEKNLVFLNEIGLDPGIDHASAMKIIDEIKDKGGRINVFKSYCGGLVAPESNNNPWGYKFSWNPRNVVVAGQSTAMYLENGKHRFIPPNRIFSQTESIHIEGLGLFDGYANRDSLSYIEPYGLHGIQTILRGTLRQNKYCEAWNVLVKMGLTDDALRIPSSDTLKISEICEAFLPPSNENLKARLEAFMGKSLSKEAWEMISYLELDGDFRCEIPNASPAQILQSLLEKKWLLRAIDKDMIVMQHYFEYELQGKNHKHYSSLVVKGDDNVHTAMAKTVGLPLAIGTSMILKNQISDSGVIMPVGKKIYEPLLEELGRLGILFNEIAD